jgi:ectoine hydroxylase-related dioxygenase (phytanoyl-CoA dioxygenase family)
LRTSSRGDTKDLTIGTELMATTTHLTTEQIQHYRERGYICGPRVLDDDQIARLKSRIDGHLNGGVTHPAHLRGETVEQSRAKGQLPSQKVVNLFRHDQVFADILANEAIGSLAHDLGDGPVRVWEDQMIYKPAREEGAVLAWHRDYTFWDHVGPAELFTCWIALNDATVANGCMQVIPGSHLWEMPFTREEVAVDDPHWVLEQAGIPDGADVTPVPCEVRAGHCHFHHCKTLHGSYGNSTNNTRYSYILHLMPGTTRRIGDSWNERMARVENVAVGEIVRGPQYPELVRA